jgi:hydroxymethylbilane synthase
MDIDKIRIGTRASPLALWQAEWVKSSLEAVHSGITVEIVRIKTTGDKILDSSLAKIGGKGLFVKEIEEALTAGEIDIAVHSMKDVPIQLPSGLSISVIMKREDPRDALVAKNGLKLAGLPPQARVGTGSLRRTTQLLHYRPDLEIVPMRGNVQTRLGKMETEQLDAIVLAQAGLKRLGISDIVTETLAPELILPAMGQGAVGIETRTYALDIIEAIVPLDDEETHLALDAERGFLEILGGGCQVPIGVYATIDGQELTLRGLVASLDGKTVLRLERKGPAYNGRLLGMEAGREILSQGADRILKEIYK